MRELFIELDQIIDKVDFGKIWNGFARYDFALYDEESVYLKSAVIPRVNRFLGNTAIEYDGAFIAIWSIEDTSTEDAEVLAADIVHEMFHAYQKEKGESRFPNDLKMLDYPYSTARRTSPSNTVRICFLRELSLRKMHTRKRIFSIVSCPRASTGKV